MSGSDDTTEVVRGRRKGIVADSIGKSLLALIPALAAGYFSMREAKIAADIEIARIQSKNRDVHEVVSAKVNEEQVARAKLTDDALKLAQHVAKLEAKLNALTDVYVKIVQPEAEESRSRTVRRVAAEAKDVLSKTDASDVEPEKLFAKRPAKPLPTSFDEAAKMAK